MPAAPSQPYHTARPAFAPLQTMTASHSSSYSSTSSLSSQASSSSVPLNSPTSQGAQQASLYGSLNQQSQSQPGQQYQQMAAPQRHPSFEYRPNRDGAGQTAAETTNFLNGSALLAEAAKRAQMAVVMRDIEGMEL